MKNIITLLYTFLTTLYCDKENIYYIYDIRTNNKRLHTSASKTFLIILSFMDRLKSNKRLFIMI